MKRVFLVHGWGGSSTSDFLPWLKSELEKKGFKISAPDMSDTETPVIEKWVETLSDSVGIPDEDTYFIGHSIGCQTILRYLETIDVSVGGAIFVAGWFSLGNLESEEMEIAKPWIETPIDIEKINSVLKDATLIISENDPYGCFDENTQKFSSIVTKTKIIQNAGHFNPDDGYAEFPLLIQELESLIKD